MRRATMAVLALSFFVACSGQNPPKSTDDDNAKAFIELESNDAEDSASPTPEPRAPKTEPPAPKSEPPAPKAEPPAPKAEPPAPNKPRVAVYPAPFTAEQIRNATTNGRTYRYKIEIPNKPTREHVITFRNVDDSGAELHSEGGHSKRYAWHTLQEHAEFPRDKVTKREEKLKTPAGKFECIVYEVAGEDGEVSTYYFAKQLPGAPVFFYVERNGKRLRTTTLVEHIPGR